jgi:hypothetical protein
LFPSQITLKIKGTGGIYPKFCLSQQKKNSAGSKTSFDPQTGQDDRISKAEALLHLHMGTEVQNKDKEKMHHILAQGKQREKKK